MSNHNPATDRQGRTPADRIAAVNRAGAIAAEERAAATALLIDLLAAAARHGVTLDDLDWVTDLPGACLDVTAARPGRPCEECGTQVGVSRMPDPYTEAVSGETCLRDLCEPCARQRFADS